MPPRTPRRTASKKTPYKARGVKEPREELEEPQEGAKFLDLVKYYKEKDKIRDEYIQALKNENNFLRARSSSEAPSSPAASVDYGALLGLTVTEAGGALHCRHSIEKEAKTSFLEFTLEYTAEEQCYTYRLQDTNIEELPEFLKKEISFQQGQIKLFFFNAYEAVVKKE